MSRRRLLNTALIIALITVVILVGVICIFIE
jgi:hypothetical protein